MMDQLLGNQKVGKVFVISAPAGTGKSTLVQMLLQEFPQSLAESCSCTTRASRPGEIDGRHYYFLSPSAFEQKLKRGEFLESAEVFGNHYGTLHSEVERIQNAGKHAILVIDTQGALQIKKKIKAIFIFIRPPSQEELLRRLKGRGTENAADIETRFSWSANEIAAAKEYDYQIVNDSLELTYQILRSIFIAESHKNPQLAHPT